MKKTIIRPMLAMSILLGSIPKAKASCDAPFTGEFIICQSQVDEFFEQLEENCDGVIDQPITLTILTTCSENIE